RLPTFFGPGEATASIHVPNRRGQEGQREFLLPRCHPHRTTASRIDRATATRIERMSTTENSRERAGGKQLSDREDHSARQGRRAPGASYLTIPAPRAHP